MPDLKVPPARLREGASVYLRALTPDDVPRWTEWFNDHHVTKDLNKGAFPNTPEKQAEVFERLRQSRTDVQVAVALSIDESLVGIVGIHHIDWVHRRGDISIVIGERSAWGNGVATEAIGLIVGHAFEKLNLHKLTAGMWATNAGSRRAFEKAGFVLEGTLRGSFWSEGRWVDEHRFGLLRDDWATSREPDAR